MIKCGFTAVLLRGCIHICTYIGTEETDLFLLVLSHA